MIENFLLNGIASVATFFLVFAYIPQMVRTYRTKDVTGISLQFWIIMNAALTLMLINSVVIFIAHGTWGYMVTEAFNEGMAAIILGMVLKYRNKEAY